MKKRRKLSNILNYCFYLFLFSLVCSFIFLHYFKVKLGPGLIECAENEVKRLTILVMNNCIRNYISSTDSVDDLLQVVRNQENEVEFIHYDTKKVNEMTSLITEMLENDLGYMVKGDFDKIDMDLKYISEDYYTKMKDGIVFTVSFGSATGNSLLANVGPKIPLHLSIVEDVVASVQTKVTEYGINNAMVEVSIQVEATTVIQMPFLSKKVTVEQNIPVTMEMIQGKIPSCYFGNNSVLE